MNVKNFILFHKAAQLLGNSNVNTKLSIRLAFQSPLECNVINENLINTNQVFHIHIKSKNETVGNISLGYQLRIEKEDGEEITNEKLFECMQVLYFREINSLLTDISLPPIDYESLNDLLVKSTTLDNPTKN